MSGHDWWEWHADYDRPGSEAGQRLVVVQRRIALFLDALPPGSTARIVAACAGQGRDLLGALAVHPRRDDVRARLVEIDPRNVEVAEKQAAGAGLGRVEVVCGDAGLTDSYLGMVPAELVLLCGIFGNVADADIRATIAVAPQLCAPGAAVIWTRHRYPPDLTPTIRGWFAECGFREEAFESPGPGSFSVGVHRLLAEPPALKPGRRMFRFL